MKKWVRKWVRISDPLNAFITWVNRLRALGLLKRTKRRAEKLKKITRSQVFVVKIKGRVTFLTKKQFKSLRAKKVFPKNFTADSLKRISLYYTP
jgi:hypothetical protein